MIRKLILTIFLFFSIALITNDSAKLIIPLSTIEKNYTDFLSIQDLYHNNDIIGRLEIPSLFNLYLVKTTDNSYYLNHNIYKEYDIKGTPFIDYRFTNITNQINIYGHNSKTFSLPFQNITKYLDYNYFLSHNIIYLELESDLRTYQIFLFKEISDDIEHMIITQNITAHIDKLKENYIYFKNISYNSNSEILILQTCTLKHPPSYYLLCAIRI